MVDPITQMAIMSGWMRKQRGEPEVAQPGPTMDAWKARIPQDIGGVWPTHPRAMSQDEVLDMVANAVTPLAGTTKPILKASQTGIRALLDMDASSLASLTKAQFAKLRKSLPGDLTFNPAEHGASFDEFGKARQKLFEESQRRSRVADDLRKADAMSPHIFKESAPSRADLSRSYGPGKRGRSY